MEELLNNPLIQAAIVTVIVTAMNAVVALIKQKFPTQAALVESNWCYLQPVVTAAIAAAKAQASGITGTAVGITGTAVGNIIAKALDDFSQAYKALEGKEASGKELSAARTEIAAAVAKALEG